MAELSASVGRGGRNVPADVELAQKLLAAKGVYSARVTGACDNVTVEAIKSFQQAFMHTPDGRVDRDGKTWQRLQAAAGRGGVAAPATDPGPYRRYVQLPARDTLNRT